MFCFFPPLIYIFHSVYLNFEMYGFILEEIAWLAK